MTDLSTIRDEWPIWSERFLAKSKRFGFKDLLLGKLSIPTADEEIDVESESGKKKSVIIELNEIAYSELILSIDIKTSSGKVAFNLMSAPWAGARRHCSGSRRARLYGVGRETPASTTRCRHSG